MRARAPGALPNAGPLQSYDQLTTSTNCGPAKLRARVLQHPQHPLNAALYAVLSPPPVLCATASVVVTGQS